MTFLVKSKAFLPSKSLPSAWHFSKKFSKKYFPPVVLMVLQLPINFCQEAIFSIIHWVHTYVDQIELLLCQPERAKKRKEVSKEKKLWKLARKVAPQLKISILCEEQHLSNTILDFGGFECSSCWIISVLVFVKPSNHHLTKNQERRGQTITFDLTIFTFFSSSSSRDTHVFDKVNPVKSRRRNDTSNAKSVVVTDTAYKRAHINWLF